MEEVRNMLYKVIDERNFILNCEEVVKISQKLDKLILKYYVEKDLDSCDDCNKKGCDDCNKEGCDLL